MDSPSAMDMPDAQSVVRRTVLRADALVVLIGENWLDDETMDSDASSDGFLRAAITARLSNLRSGKDLQRVWPVLVNREPDPTFRSLALLGLQRLAAFQRLRLRDWEWDSDVARTDPLAETTGSA